ncbi:MAG TPA: hypothetical protein VHT51_15820 [Micropepsaceae bacterium]|nr:hypothetical protein [Micropepsaceae bacterium]
MADRGGGRRLTLGAEAIDLLAEIVDGLAGSLCGPRDIRDGIGNTGRRLVDFLGTGFRAGGIG